MKHLAWSSRRRTATLLALASLLPLPALAQAPAASSAPALSTAEAVMPLFAVEIKTGPAWDSTKTAQEQAYFREHSANLKMLRDQGSLVMGARYADKGLVVLQAATVQEAHALMQQDPAMQHRTFTYELHPFNVFYSGALNVRRRAL